MKQILTALALVVILAGCAISPLNDQDARSTAPESVVGKTWQWVSTITPVEEITATAPDRYTILLQPDGRVQARFDCNRGGGTYEIGKATLTFGPLMSTRMACPPDSQAARFTRDLQRVCLFFLADCRS